MDDVINNLMTIIEEGPPSSHMKRRQMIEFSIKLEREVLVFHKAFKSRRICKTWINIAKSEKRKESYVHVREKRI